MYVYVCGHKEIQICQMRSNKRAEVMIVKCYLKSSKSFHNRIFSSYAANIFNSPDKFI